MPAALDEWPTLAEVEDRYIAKGAGCDRRECDRVSADSGDSPEHGAEAARDMGP